MSKFFIHLRRYDWLLLGASLTLIFISLISLFSLSKMSAYSFFERQLLWVGIGLVVMVGASFVDFRIFKNQSFAVLLLYLISLFLLGVVFWGGVSIRGIRAWISAGPFYFQPVEFTKLALIILLAKFFSKRHIEIYRVQHLIVSGAYAAIPAILVLLQPDLGSAIVLIGIWISIVVFSGIKLRHFLMLAALGIIISFGVWNFTLAPYQQARVISFINPYKDPQGTGYQMIQSMIAVGSGRVWGKGLGYGSQTHLHFLPEAETDFIFAAFAEEWGFAGTLVLLFLIFVVLWRVVWIGILASDNFSRIYAIGFASLVFIQVFIHIGMNMGVLPVTGLTLPFVSYGGSSLIILLIGIGILQNIKINSRKETIEDSPL